MVSFKRSSKVWKLEREHYRRAEGWIGLGRAFPSQHPSVYTVRVSLQFASNISNFGSFRLVQAIAFDCVRFGWH